MAGIVDNTDVVNMPSWGDDNSSFNKANNVIPMEDNAPDTPLQPQQDPTALKVRASKYNFALGDNSPGEDKLYYDMVNNLEDGDRKQAAIDKTLKLAGIRNQMVRGIIDQAANEGRDTTQAETDAIFQLSDLALTDAATRVDDSSAPQGTLVQTPDTIFEREFAEKVLTNSIDTNEETPYYNAWLESPDSVHSSMDVFSDVATYKEAYQKLADEVDAIAKNQSTAGYVLDIGKNIIPFYGYFKTKNLLKNTPNTSLLYGNNMDETVKGAYTGRPEDTVPMVRKAILQLARDNPSLAQAVAHNLVDYPSSEKLLDNLLQSGIDYSTIIPFGLLSKGLKAATAEKIIPSAELKVANQYRAGYSAAVDTAKETAKTAQDQFKKVISSVGNTVLRKDATIPEVLDSAGQVKPSAALSIVDKIVNAYSSIGANASEARAFLNELPGIFNAWEVTGGLRSTWATAMTSKTLEELLNDAQQGLGKLFLDSIKQNKYGPAAIRAATEAAGQTFKLERRDLENSIMNVFENNVGLNLGDHQAVIHLGTETAEPFATKDLADNTLKLYGLEGSGARSVQAGNGWAIQIQRPMDFSLESVRDAMKVDAKNNPTPWANVLGRALTTVRSGDDVLPTSVVETLKRVTYGASGLERMILQSAKRIGKLRGDEAKNFQDFIKSEMLEFNPAQPDKLGAMSSTPGEFEQKFFNKFGKLPSEAQKNAYFTYRYINDMHFAGLNLGLYLDKNAIGLLNLNVKGLAGSFEGKVVPLEALDKLSENLRVMVLEDGVDPWNMWTQYKNIKEEGQELSNYARIKELVQQKGYVVHAVSDVGDDQIRTLLGEDAVGRGGISFVVAKDTRATPLSLKQVPYQAGIHNILPDGGFISQARLFNDSTRNIVRYYGDRNIFFAGGEKLGKEFASKMEEFRQLYKSYKQIKKSKDPLAWAAARKAAQDYAKKNLPVSFKVLEKDFGKKGRLDIDSPILYRASNQSLADAHNLSSYFPNSQFVVHANSEGNLYRGRVNLEFATERGLPIREVVRAGDPTAPLYGLRQARFLDPAAALDRGVSAMVRGKYMEPAKTEIAEKFLSEFGDIIDVPVKEAAQDPIRALFQGTIKKNVQGEDIERARQAAAFQARAKQFFGKAKPLEAKYWEYLGSKVLGDDPEAASAWRQSLAEILKDGDPYQMMRKIAYYPKMGFWNIKQLFQQSNTFANVMALTTTAKDPTRGLRAGAYSMLMRWGELDSEKLLPRAMQMADDWFGPGSGKELKEIIETLDRSGFGKMGREVATREQHMQGNVIQTKVGAFLDHGLFFMREGEEFVRRAAWAAAYMEKKAERLGKGLSDNDLAAVLNRADLYNANMSHASNAAWQQGAVSVPTQFWSYQIRMMEQLMGKRLTNIEKAKLLGTYSLLYGIPVGAMTTIMPLWPVHESIKEWLISHNINTDDNLIIKTFNDGVVSLVLQGMLGEDTNVESVYGPSGVPLLKDVMDGSKGPIEAMFGASGNVLFNTLSAISPALMWIGQSIIGEEREPLKAQDFMDVLNNITTLSTMEKMYVAMTTQSYLTKYGQTIGTNDSKVKMLFENILGIQPQAIDDMYRTMQVNEDYAAYMRKLNRWVQEDIRNGLRAENPDERASWFKRASVKSKWYPNIMDRNKAIYTAVTENKDLIERARQFHARQSREAADFEARKRLQTGVK